MEIVKFFVRTLYEQALQRHNRRSPMTHIGTPRSVVETAEVLAEQREGETGAQLPRDLPMNLPNALNFWRRTMGRRVARIAGHSWETRDRWTCFTRAGELWTDFVNGDTHSYALNVTPTAPDFITWQRLSGDSDDWTEDLIAVVPERADREVINSFLFSRSEERFNIPTCRACQQLAIITEALPRIVRVRQNQIDAVCGEYRAFLRYLARLLVEDQIGADSVANFAAEYNQYRLAALMHSEELEQTLGRVLSQAARNWLNNAAEKSEDILL